MTRAQRWEQLERTLVLIGVGLLFAIPVIDKVPGPYPPQWFATKFESTFLGAIPGALTGSFALITLAELIIPALCLWALIRGEHRKPTPPADAPLSAADYALAGASLLLLALTVGSLIARDYPNAFYDFGYFVGVLFLRGRAFPTRGLTSGPS